MDATKVFITMGIFDEHGKGYSYRWNITSDKVLVTPNLLKEIEYALNNGVKYLMLDLKPLARRSRPTNPFAWSPGPR
jgi:hypothetical protein